MVSWCEIQDYISLFVGTDYSLGSELELTKQGC